MDRTQWNERYASKPTLWEVDPSPFLSGELGDRPPGRALDLGAGEGRTAVWLAERGWEVTAVDFSDVALEKGRRRVEAEELAGSVEWICADLVDFDPAGAYDLVLLMFIHLPRDDRRRLLARAAATLSPGGTVLVVGYDTTHEPTGQQGGGPQNRFSPDDIVAELDGLRIERADRVRVGDAVDAVVRAVRD